MGLGHGLGDFADELFERGHGGGGELGAGDAYVHVEVGNGVIHCLGVLFHPLGRTDEAFLFRVPTAEKDGSLGLPALLEKRADAVDGLKHGGGAAVGVDCAVDPGVAMVAVDHPFIGVLRTADPSNDIPNQPSLVVLLRDQMHAHAAAAEVIAKGQRALPSLRHARAFQRLQNRRGVVVTDGDGDDVRLVAVGLDACGVGQIGRGRLCRGSRGRRDT